MTLDLAVYDDSPWDYKPSHNVHRPMAGTLYIHDPWMFVEWIAKPCNIAFLHFCGDATGRIKTQHGFQRGTKV